MYEGSVRCSGGIATPGPPSRLTLERLTTRSSPLTSHRRALTSGPLHSVVSGQHRGTPGSNIRTKPTAKSTPCRPDASVPPLQVPAAAPSVTGPHPGDACRLFGHAITPSGCGRSSDIYKHLEQSPLRIDPMRLFPIPVAGWRRHRS